MDVEGCGIDDGRAREKRSRRRTCLTVRIDEISHSVVRTARIRTDDGIVDVDQRFREGLSFRNI